MIALNNYSEFMTQLAELEKRKIIIVPHGSFVAYLSLEEHKKMTIPYFGNKAVLDWEASRELQRQWLTRAGLKLPRQFRTGAEIDRPVIVKLYGAQGGKGYMFIRDAHDFEARAAHLQGRLHHPGVHHRRSALHPLFLFAAETEARDHVDGPPLRDQRRFARAHPGGRAGRHGREPVLRRGRQSAGLAARVDAGRSAAHGRDVVRVSKEICGPKGLFGAFCIETIITPDMQFYIMEISARIVAGTNLFIDGSPYSYLNYTEPMSTGRRIAREIKNALLTNNLRLVLG